MQLRNGAVIPDCEQFVATCLSGRSAIACYNETKQKARRVRGGAHGFRRSNGKGAMALSAKLTMRQGQTMVLTPQLLQAIKLLQMLPNVELSAFIENELTSNPLLERAEDQEGREAERLEGVPEAPAAEAVGRPATGRRDALETDCAALEANLGTEVENAFEPRPNRARRRKPGSARAFRPAPRAETEEAASTSGAAPDLEAYVFGDRLAARPSRAPGRGHPGRSGGADDRRGR